MDLKTNRLTLKLCVVIFITALGFRSFSQTENFKSQLAFIENVGQYDGRNWQDSKIEFAYAKNPFYIFFTKKGLTYRFDKIIKNPNRVKGDTTIPKRINISELVHVEWLNSNEDVEIIKEGQVESYYSFAIRTGNWKETINKSGVKGYSKVTYKNMYDNIDVVYHIDPRGGIKYNIILHPGANLSDVQLKYASTHTNTKDENISILLNNQNQIEINTSLGQIIEHIPFSFYENSNEEIKSNYKFENNILSFELEEFDATQTIIIDPWINSPTYNTSTAVWEVETDGFGNVYTIGGETPMELKKYSAAGVLQWTYTTPWDTNTVWLGTLATDNVGTSYITSGTSPEIERIDNGGTMIWHTNGSGGLSSDEFWSITFNCDKTKLLVGGTRFQNLFDPYAAIFDIDVNTGSVLSFATFAYTDLTVFGATPVEVRSITSTKNARYAYLTHNDVGTISQNLGTCPTNDPYYQVDNGHNLGYKCEDYLPETQNGGGLKAITANDLYIYTHAGDQIYQRDLNTGALINTVNLTGGNAATVPITGGIVVSNSGLDVDDCGNVYAGSGDRVVKFDQNLNVLAQTTTTFTVYDVSVNANGEVVAVGAQSDNSATNRNGRIESINLSACAQFSLVCCDANVCPVDTLCVTDPSFAFVPNTPGGTWSGTGVDATGNFDPATAGAGTHTITYTLTCGSFSFDVVVNSCATLTACLESNGDITVSGGTGPFTWENWEVVGQHCDGPVVFGVCTGTMVDDYGWATFGGTTATETPPGNGPIQVTDAVGGTVTINDVSTLTACSTTCDPTISAAGPFCQSDAAVNLTAVDAGGTWSGTGITDANLGTFDPVTAGAGTHTITYTLSGACAGSSDTETITVNATDDATFSYANSSYCTTDPNPSPDAVTTTGGTFTIDNGGTINPTTGEIDIATSGAGTFIVTYTTAGACPSSSTFTVTLTSGANATISTAGPFCESDAAVNLTAVDAGGTWSGTGVTDVNLGTFDPATAGAGTHTITYTISGSCGATDTETITVNAADDATFSYANSSYCLTDPNPSPDAVTTTGGTFTIDNGGTINPTTGEIDIATSGAGTFIVTYTTAGSCPSSSTFTVTLTSGADATISAAGPFCESDAAVNLTAVDAGGTWSGTGITDTNLGTFDPATAGAGTHTITYTISGSCGATDTETITVNAADDATFSYANSSYCLTDPNPSPDAVTTTGGTFTIDNGGTINPTTGEIDITTSGAGTFIVTYTTAGACPSSSSFTVTLTSGADATIPAAGPFCESDAAVNLTAVDAGGTWSGTGITDANLGTFDPATAGAGTHTITYTISGSCGATDTETITVNAADDATFSYANSSYCLTDPNPSPDAVTTTGGTFTIDNGGTINPTTGEIDIATSGAGTFIVTYTTAGACPSSSTFTVTLTSGADATISAVGPFCESDAAVNLTAVDAGGTWSGTGITDANLGTFDPATAGAGTHTITYTISGSCGATDTETITVNAADDATFSFTNTTFCTSDDNPIPNITGTAGGIFTIDNGGIINASSGEINLGSTLPGNYTVTYTTNGTCPATSNITVTISNGGNILLDSIAPLCISEDTLILTSNTPGGVWSGTGIVDGNLGTFAVNDAGEGTHTITYTVTGACGGTETMDIIIYPQTIATITPSVTIDYGMSVDLLATGGGSYLWIPETDLSCSDCENPTATPETTTTYCVEVNKNGCIDTACTTITVDYNCGDVFVPNAFSPNGDAANNLECVYGNCIVTMNFRVYDRWGELVFETTDINECWDGTYKGRLLSSQVFVYLLDATLISGEQVNLKGNISLIR